MLPRPAIFAILLRRLRAKHGLVACGLITGVLLALGTALLIVQGRREATADAERELKNLSLVLAEETDRAFQSMEQAQLGLMEHLRERGIDTPEKFDRELASLEVHQDLLRRIAGLPQISALALVSRGGHLVNHSLVWPIVRVDLADRDFFLALSNDPGRASFISAPVQTRSTGTWTILFARAFTGPDGQLIGIVNAGLQVDIFEHLFARIAVDGDPSFSMFRSDGVLLVRYPRMDTSIGRDYHDTSDFPRLLASLDREVVVGPGMLTIRSS